MKNDYIPRKESDLLLWHDKFLAGATGHGTTLGLTAPNLAAITADNEDLHADITASVTADAAAAAKSATATKKATITRVVTAARGYTAAMDDTMGIEGPEDTTDLSTSKPTLTGKAKGGGSVEIAFNKSTSDGVNIYCRRDGDPGPVFLARDTASPYVDNRPLLVAGKPEVREYRATYVVGDAEIGSASDEAVITATP